MKKQRRDNEAFLCFRALLPCVCLLPFVSNAPPHARGSPFAATRKPFSEKSRHLVRKRCRIKIDRCLPVKKSTPGLRRRFRPCIPPPAPHNTAGRKHVATGCISMSWPAKSVRQDRRIQESPCPGLCSIAFRSARPSGKNQPRKATQGAAGRCAWQTGGRQRQEPTQSRPSAGGLCPDG